MVSSKFDPKRYTPARLDLMLQNNNQYPELHRVTEDDVMCICTFFDVHRSSRVNRIIYGQKSEDWTDQDKIHAIIDSVDRELKSLFVDRWGLHQTEIDKIVRAKIFLTREFKPEDLATIIRCWLKARKITLKIDSRDVKQICKYLVDFKLSNYCVSEPIGDGRSKKLLPELLAELHEDLRNAKASEEPQNGGSSVDAPRAESIRGPSSGSFEDDLVAGRPSGDRWTDCSSLDTLRAESGWSPSVQSVEEPPQQPAEFV